MTLSSYRALFTSTPRNGCTVYQPNAARVVTLRDEGEEGEDEEEEDEFYENHPRSGLAPSAEGVRPLALPAGSWNTNGQHPPGALNVQTNGSTLVPHVNTSNGSAAPTGSLRLFQTLF